MTVRDYSAIDILITNDKIKGRCFGKATGTLMNDYFKSMATNYIKECFAMVNYIVRKDNCSSFINLH